MLETYSTLRFRIEDTLSGNLSVGFGFPEPGELMRRLGRAGPWTMAASPIATISATSLHGYASLMEGRKVEARYAHRMP